MKTKQTKEDILRLLKVIRIPQLDDYKRQYPSVLDGVINMEDTNIWRAINGITYSKKSVFSVEE